MSLPFIYMLGGRSA